MTRALQKLKQIAKLADEAAQELTGEDRQAAIEIKLAANCVLDANSKPETKNAKPARHD